ncbi:MULTISPECIES: hypothetical protein [Streptomyces]|uniref:Uncharacterized protein n=1 Tax=Streptomyces anulatus TaxID=1892 RepID=A0ABZ1ZC48_STRAQ|nr:MULTISPECIES: hypothetical protein [Streptomyces]
MNGNRPADILNAQATRAQDLANSALDIVTRLNKESMYHSPVISAAYARIRQLAHLAYDAADHLVEARDVLIHAQAGLPMELGDGFWPSRVSRTPARRSDGASLSFRSSPLSAPPTPW